MQEFLIKLLICSATMSVLALIYMAVMPLLAKHYSAKGRYYAWLVIVVGLIIPFRPYFDNALVKVDVVSETAAPILHTANVIPATITAEKKLLAHNTHSILWWQMAAACWVMGVLVYLIYHLLKHYHFTKMTKRWSEEITDEMTLILLHDLKTEMGIAKKINLYQCSCTGTPMMIGFTSSRILLPKISISPNELYFILKHELYHYKQKDLWYKCLVLAANAIHWFNPIVYIIAKAINVQCELACDAAVTRDASTDTRLHYSETIIGIVRYQSKLQTTLSTNFFGGKKGMKKRISSIMDSSTKKKGIMIICAVLLATLGAGLALTADVNAGASQAETSATADADTHNATSFEQYTKYGLTYDKATEKLYFNNTLVRYFTDYYPIDGDSTAGLDYYNENGTIDVHGVRDLTQVHKNADGSFEPGGTLIGVEPYSSDIAVQEAVSEAQNSQHSATTSATAEEIPLTPDELAKEYDIYKPFGLIYDKNSERLYYNGKLVREFQDIMATNGKDLTGGEFSGTIRQLSYDNGIVEVHTVRDFTVLDTNGYGKLTGIEVES